jgi:hypothetical protein
MQSHVANSSPTFEYWVIFSCIFSYGNSVSHLPIFWMLFSGVTSHKGNSFNISLESWTFWQAGHTILGESADCTKQFIDGPVTADKRGGRNAVRGPENFLVRYSYRQPSNLVTMLRRYFLRQLFNQFIYCNLVGSLVTLWARKLVQGWPNYLSKNLKMVYVISMESVTKLNLCQSQYFVFTPTFSISIFISSGKFEISVCSLV